MTKLYRVNNTPPWTKKCSYIFSILNRLPGNSCPSHARMLKGLVLSTAANCSSRLMDLMMGGVHGTWCNTRSGHPPEAWSQGRRHLGVLTRIDSALYATCTDEGSVGVSHSCLSTFELFFPPAVDMMDKVIAREKVPPHSLEYSSDRTAPQVKGVADDVKEMSITRYDLTLPGEWWSWWWWCFKHLLQFF